jgi:hypothetical protein
MLLSSNRPSKKLGFVAVRSIYDSNINASRVETDS